jgi:cell wall-associated NlpC family hydrolase
MFFSRRSISIQAQSPSSGILWTVSFICPDFHWQSGLAIRYHLTLGNEMMLFPGGAPTQTLAFLPMVRNRYLDRAQTALFAVLLCVSGVFAKSSTQIVVVPVANMYSGPSDQSDVVSQAIYGSNVTLLTARGEWCRIQTTDHYRGWIPSRQLRLVQSGAGYATDGVIVRVYSLFANLYREPDVTRHKPLITIPFESHLVVIPDEGGAGAKTETSQETKKATKAETKKEAKKISHDGWLQVRLPDKRSAWIQSSDVVTDLRPLSIPESIELARRFLGIPYLWGGTSSFGFDCSGFTQMLMRVRGINMPRDADKQAAWSGAVAVDRTTLQPGDLLFFGASARNITHTGMYIGDGQFIHDSTNERPVVQIGRIDDQPWTQLLVACRRVK